MLIINIIIYAIISIYLDLVFPNEFGNKKHPLFFLDYCRSNKIYDNLETKKNYKIEE
jgi:ATP-binding cassette subfamily A (ABC1) protein 3